MGGGGGTQTVYQKAEPWEGAQELARKVVGPGGLGEQWWNYVQTLGPQYEEYLNMPWVAEFTPQQQLAFELTERLATNPDILLPGWNYVNYLLAPERQAAVVQEMQRAYSNVFQPTIEGRMLSPETNPYLEAYAQAATRPIEEQFLQEVVPALRTQAEQAGRYGSGIYNQLMSNIASETAKKMGEVRAGIYAPAYEAERARQMEAARLPYELWPALTTAQLQAMSPYLDLINQAYKQIGYLATVGEEQQRLNQAKIEEARQKFLSQLWDPYQLIAALGNLAFTGGQLGGTTMSQVPYYQPSLASQLLGYGATGLGLGALLGMF